MAISVESFNRPNINSKMSNLLLSFPKTEPFSTPFKMDDTVVSVTSPLPKRKISKGESIHSGHFMVSDIDETETEAEKSQSQSGHESDYERDEDACTKLSNYEPLQAKETTQTYVYGSKANSWVQIDSSLTKLFECMSLAYNGKITSPRWKTFKGLKLPIKDKIRLNNIIWRAWHIQYIAGRNPVVCQFSSSADTKRHKQTEAILLEGKYWKRRVDAVKAEYKKWRMFHHRTGCPHTPSRPTDFDLENLPRWSNNLSNIDSMFSCEDSGDFFSLNYTNSSNSFGNYYDYNSREIARSGMGAQFMQPGLEQLQPNVDFMDTFEPIHDVISRIQNHNLPLPTVHEESVNFDVNINSKDVQDELLNLFESSTDQVTGTIANNITKPMINPNYPTDNIFQANDQIIDLNSKINNSNIMVDSQQTPMTGTFDVSKMEMNINDYTYQNQMVHPNMGSLFDQSQSLQESSPISQMNQSKGNMSMSVTQPSMYTNKIAFDPSGNNPTMGHSNDNSFGINRYQTSTRNVHEMQPQQSINMFQTDPTMFYHSPEMSHKNAKNKYQYSSFFSNKPFTNSTSEPVQKSSGLANRYRSRSISGGNKSVTIKSLLNRPSLVSTMNQRDNFGGSTSFSTLNSNQNDMQIRSNIERSLSLPTSIAGRQAKTGLNNQRYIQRNPETSSNVPFENSTKLSNNANYSFESGISNFYQNSVSATPSPMSSQSSPYSNPDTQLLPQVTQNVQRKLSASSLESSQFGVPPPMATPNFAFGGSNQMSNVMQSTSNVMDNSSNVFTSHLNISPSSSSAIITETTSTTITTTNNPLTHSNSFAIGSAQSQFNMMNNVKNICYKTETNKDSNTKRNHKSRTSTFVSNEFVSHREKMQSFRDSTDLSSSGSIITKANTSRDMATFKHMTSGIVSPNPLCSSFNLPTKSEERSLYKERRRVCHINAEQKRRCNIKNGFDTLRNLLPNLSSNANSKISKAAMLQKAADYIRILKSEKYEQQKEYDLLKQQVENLNQTISMFQSQLPATGAPVVGQRSSQIKEQYANYVQTRTMQNWKFWIFSIIMESLLESYCNTVATSNFDEMCKTLFRWLDQSCCLITLRRDVLNSLRYISTSTNILTNPESLPEEAILAVTKANPNLSKEDDNHRTYQGL